MASDETVPQPSGGVIRFSMEINLTAEQIIGLLPMVAERAGLSAVIHNSPVLHIGVNMQNESKNEAKSNTRSVQVGGDATGIGAMASTTGDIGDITVYMDRVKNSSGISDDIKAQLSKAADVLAKSKDISEDDKTDVTESLGKLTSELEKGEEKRDQGRLARYFNRIKDVAPAVTAVLSIIAGIIGIEAKK
jgi:hypothetical protein